MENDYIIWNADCLEMLEQTEENSIDSIVTDPPYELNFMGKGWDNAGISFNKETWKKCLKVLKPGGYLLAFGGSRTFHRIACAIEDAGFEIRDTIMWLYGSGFPKSMDIGKAVDKKNGVQPIGRKEPTGGITGGKNTGAKQKGWHSINNWYEYPECKNEWKGWGSALKPSFEPIIVARKPFKGSLVANVIEHGVGGMNIDECRVDFVNEKDYKITFNKNQHEKFGTPPMTNNNVYGDYSMIQPKNYTASGRFPANTILTYNDTDYDEVCGGFPNSGKGNSGKPYNYAGREYNNKDTSMFNGDKPQAPSNYNDSGSAARYFYCAKASKKDRDEGLENFEQEKVNNGRETPIDNAFQRGETLRKNIHPTVKPTELMQYLVRLVSPKGATILDPFMGSGSTGKAVMYENKERNANYSFIGIEQSKEYCEIAEARIKYVKEN